MWLLKLRLKLALWLLPRGHTIASIVHLDRARAALEAAQQYIANSGHLTRAYKAGRRLRGDLAEASDELTLSQQARLTEREDTTPDKAS